MKGVFSALLAGVAFVAIINSAHAGFQWTAPSDTAARAPQAQPSVQAAPVSPVMAENLPQNLNDIPRAPEYAAGSNDDPLTWNQPVSANKATAKSDGVYVPRNNVPRASQQAPVQQPVQQPVQMAAPVAPVQAAPIMAAPVQATTPIPQAPVAATPYYAGPTPVSVAPQGNFTVAEGFGSDLPLVMAIRQIVPTEYGFVFDEGINLGSNVSWQGGQPWNVVLQNVLTPLNLRAQISGSMVSILPANKTSDVTISQNAAVVVSEAIIQNGAEKVTASAPASLLHTAAWEAESMVAQPIAAQAFGQPDLHERTVWTAGRNTSLRSILEDWSARAGVELYWASEYDYPVQTGVQINGTFEEAVQTLLRGLSESKPRPLGRLHPNLPDGPAVLLIETRDANL